MDSPDSVQITDKDLLLDYLGFGRIVLPRQAKALLLEYERATDDRARRALGVALVSTWMQQYEQLGAWLLAIKTRVTKGDTIFNTIRSYRTGDADLASVAAEFVSVDVMAAQLGFDIHEVSKVWSQRGAHTRLSDVLQGLQESTAIQADYRTFYNKSKHGMAVIFDSGTGTGPCALPFEGDVLSCLKWTDDQATFAARQVCRLADVAADMVALFMLSQDPELKAEIERVVDFPPRMPLVDWLDLRYGAASSLGQLAPEERPIR